MPRLRITKRLAYQMHGSCARTMFPSIRSFLAFSYTLVALLVISALGLSIQVLVERNLRANLDADLVARSRQVEQFILSQPDADLARQVEQLTTGTGFGGQETDTTYLRVYIASGFPLPGPVLPVQEATPQELQRLPALSLITMSTADGVLFRMLTRKVVYNDQLLAYFQVVRSLEPVERIASRLRDTLAAGGLLAAAVAGSTAYILAHQALKPFSAIVEDSRHISADQLDLRLPTSYGVDEVSRLAYSFNSLLDRLQKAFELQRRFVADASHELRTPLTTIRGNVDVLLLDPDLKPETREALQQVSGESARMSRLVTNLLLLARADAGHRAASTRPVDLHALVLETVRQARSMSSTVSVSLAREDQVEVFGDSDQLKQVLLNLLENALKYTSDGGRVSVSVYTEGNWAKLEVRDTGIGIAPEDQQRIFDRFYRAERRVPGAGGSGLGLSIASWVVSAHGGRLAVESQPGLGSIFTVWLPLHPVLSNQALTPP